MALSPGAGTDIDFALPVAWLAELAAALASRRPRRRLGRLATAEASEAVPGVWSPTARGRQFLTGGHITGMAATIFRAWVSG
jgi:hypothetical protein